MLRLDGRRAWSYQTAIRDVLADGRTIGNMTRYSVTSRRHQTQAGAAYCDVVVTGVPRDTPDLRAWYSRLPKARRQAAETEYRPNG